MCKSDCTIVLRFYYIFFLAKSFCLLIACYLQFAYFNDLLNKDEGIK